MLGFMLFEELLKLGVPKGTLDSGVFFFRKGKSNSWENIKDAEDKRKVWINLDTVPDRARKKYKIPTSKEYQKQEQKQTYDLLLNPSTHKLKEAYKNGFYSYVDIYKNRLSYSIEKLFTLSEPYAKEHAYWVAMINLTGGVEKATYGTVKKMFEIHLTIIRKTEIKLQSNITSYIHFKVKLTNFRRALRNGETGIDVIIDGNLKPNTSARKITDFHIMLMLCYLQYEQIYPYRVVADLVNHHCELKGLPTISESSVKHKMFSDNAFKTLVNSKRYGKKYQNDFILPHTVRKVTPFVGNVWMIDGTPMQFYCWNADRSKKIRMYLFAIIDVCSRKIVGFDIGYSETRYNILKSLKLAVMSEGYLPSQIVSDNFSAGKTEEIIDLKEQIAKLGVSWRNAKVGNAQDKSYIERFFGTFQSVECALYEGYIGEGITSKRNNRPNAEFLQKMVKKNGLLMPNEMKSQIATMIAKYNERSINGRMSPNEISKTLGKPKAIPMDSIRTALLFWNKTSATIKRGMVKIKVNKVKHSFEIKEHHLKAELQGKKVAVRYNENALDWVMLFDYETDTAICECKASLKAEMLITDPTDKQALNIIKSEAKKKSYNAHLNKTAQDIIDKGLRQEKEQDLELVHPLSLEKNQVNTKESQDFLELYYNENEIVKEDEYKHTNKSIKKIAHSKEVDAHSLLIKKSSCKSSLEPIK